MRRPATAEARSLQAATAFALSFNDVTAQQPVSRIKNQYRAQPPLVQVDYARGALRIVATGGICDAGSPAFVRAQFDRRSET
jgi:hypothetical protein